MGATEVTRPAVSPLSGTLVDPPRSLWLERVAEASTRSGESLLGRTRGAWREEARRTLGLPPDRSLVATGHQTLLWHPGILAKYLAVEAFAREEPEVAVAELIVDQHVGDFGSFEVPVRRSDGSLGVRRIVLAEPKPDVPMALHPPFVPPPLPRDLDVPWPWVREGIERIHAAVAAHSTSGSAAAQMCRAQAELRGSRVRSMSSFTASSLCETALARAMIEAMARDPAACALAYNEAVRGVADARMPPLEIGDDRVELPLWRVLPDDRRARAFDSDVEAWLDYGEPRLLPRALLLTALLRLAACDLFVHGTGGARYDVAMEAWIRDWLGAEPVRFAVVTATLRLPLGVEPRSAADVALAVAEARRAWHDPEPPEPEPSERGSAPGPLKRQLLAAVEHAPRGSGERAAAFRAMHREAATLRAHHAGHVERSQRGAHDARSDRADWMIAARRDWAFPLYPGELLDIFAAAM